MNTEKTFILASSSPRRIEMMKKKGIHPIIMPPNIEENIPVESGMCETVMFLSFKKAQAVEQEWLRSNRNDLYSPIIIAADTIVWYDGELMGKPKDFEDGFNMLSKLRNTNHQVATGVTLLEVGTPNKKVFSEVTDVFFHDYSDEELKEYLNTEEAYDKAGGYAIQGYFSKFVDHIVGDFNTVVGFPWTRIEKELATFLGRKE